MRYLSALIPTIMSAALLAQPQVPRTDTPVTDGIVNVVKEDGNTVYLGGDFDYVGPQTGSAAMISPSTGLVNTAFPIVDGSIYAIEPDGSGGWYIGGSFTTVDGTARAGLAHIDSGYNLTAGFQANVTGAVRALAFDGSNLFVAGTFTNVGGQARGNLARVDASTGSVAAWAPAPDDTVSAIAVASGVVYFGGDFLNVNGTSRSRVAAVDAAGTLLAWNPVATNSVRAMVATASRVYLGGSFYSVGGGSSGNPIVNRRGFAVVSATGSGASVAEFEDISVSTEVNSLVVDGNTLYIGGPFSNVRYQKFNGGIVSTAGDIKPKSDSFDDDVYVSAPDGTGGWYVGGIFTQVGGASRPLVAHLDGNGELDTAFAPNLSGLNYTQINAIAVTGSSVFIGGAVSSGTSNVTQLDASSGAIQTGWGISVAQGDVNALHVAGGELFVGGSFNYLQSSTSGTQAREGVGSLNLSTGAITNTLAGLNATGEAFAFASDGTNVYVGGQFIQINGSFRNHLGAVALASGTVAGWNPNPDAAVYALVTDGTDLFLGGLFQNLGTTGRTRVASYDLSGLTLQSFAPTPNDAVESLQVGGGFLYIGGAYTNVSGASRDGLARVDSGTGAVDPWDPLESSQHVYTLSIAGGELFAGGKINTFDVGRRGGASFDLTTEDLLAFDPDVNVGVISALAVQGATVYVSGTLTEIGSAPRLRLAAVDISGALLSFQCPLGGDAFALYADATQVLVGGDFASAGGALRTNLAAYDKTTRAVTAWAPAGAPVLYSMFVDATTVYAAGSAGVSYDRATAAAEAWSPATDGVVRALHGQGSSIYMGGSFTYLERYGRTHFVLLDPSTGQVNQSFASAPNYAYAAVPDGSGGWYVGGRYFLNHYLAGGVLDTAFNVDVGAKVVEALVLSGGKLYMGGTFDTVNGASRPRLAAVDASTGVIDTWNPGSSGEVVRMYEFGGRLYILGNFGVVAGQARDGAASFDLSTGNLTTWAPDPTGSPRALAYDGTWLYMGGGFSQVGGLTRNYVCQISPTSSTPSSWVLDAPDDFVWDLAVQGNTLYMAGEFTTVGGQTRERLAAYDISGQSLLSWAPLADNKVEQLVVIGSAVYFGGDFVQVDGQARLRLASVDASSGNLLGWNPGMPNGQLNELVYDGTSIAVVGIFSGGFGGMPRNHVAATDTTGALLNWDVDVDGDVNALAGNTSRIYIGGDFGMAAGQARNGVAAADPSTAALDAFDADVLGTVHALALDGADLHIGGLFRAVGGVPRASLATVDATSGSVGSSDRGFGPQIYALKPDRGLLYVGGTSTYFGDSTQSSVITDTSTGALTGGLPLHTDYITRAVPDSAGGLFVVEYRPEIIGLGRFRLRRILSSGAFDTNFLLEANAEIKALYLAGTKLWVGGAFTDIDGQSVSRLARVDADSSSGTYAQLESVTLSAGGTVNAFASDGTSLFVGGSFSNLNGSVRRGLGAYTLSTAALTSLASGGAALNNGAIVRTLHVSGGVLYLGGTFTTAGGAARGNLASWNISGASWTTWAPLANFGVDCIWLDGLTAYVGGGFTMIGASSRENAAAINADSSSGQFGQPTSWAPTVDGSVLDIRVSGTDVLMAGSFDDVNGVFFGGAAVLDSATGNLTSWRQTFDAPCRIMMPYNGGYFVAGDFGVTGLNTINRLTSVIAATGVVTSWRPTVSGASIQDVAISGSSVYAVGSFSSIGGVASRNVAEFDTQPVISTASPLPDVFEGLSYTGQFIVASGGVAPYAWSIANGPAWLSINASTGELTGTVPAIAPANITFDITVADQNSDTDMRQFSFDVITVPAVSISTATPLANQYEGQAVSGLVIQAQGGAPGYQWSLQNAPGWLSIDVNTGQLSGSIPGGIAPASITFDAVVTDRASQVDSKAFSFNVVSYATIQITTAAPLPDGYPGIAYSGVFMQGTGGAQPYTWSLSGGPAWLAINPTTGELTGLVPTGTVGTTVNFDVTITDFFSNFLLQAFQIDIVAFPQPVITTTTMPDATVGVAWQTTLAASGGTGAYTWSLGYAPNWVQVNPTTGQLSGTAPFGLLGEFDVDVVVLDSFTPQQQGATSLTLRVVDATYSGNGDTWENKPNLNGGTGVQAAASQPAAVSTGSLFFVWGGSTSSSTRTNAGGIYDPASDTWLNRPNLIAGTGAPPAASNARAVWTGSYVIVWGGFSTTYTNRGGVYDPATDSWLSKPNLNNGTGAPGARTDHEMVWTGTRLIVWGGTDNSNYLTSGGVYDPETDTWENKPNLNAGTGSPAGRRRYACNWTGQQMLVWGGVEGSLTRFGDGGLYDPKSDTWSIPSGMQSGATNAPTARASFSSAWTGTRFLVWGGDGQTGILDTGGIYNPATDTWAASPGIGGAGRPTPRYQPYTTYGNGLMVVWGGDDTSGPWLNNGGVYDFVAGAWLSTPNLSNGTGAPLGRWSAGQAWVGQRFLLWGGVRSNVRRNDGGSYRPPSGGTPPMKPTINIQATDSVSAESVSGTQTGEYTITLTPAPTSPITLQYGMTGSADNTPVVDYDLTGTGVTFFPATHTIVVPAGVTSVMVTLEPVDDAAVESLETAIMSMLADASYTLGTSVSATVQIIDNDGSGTPGITPSAGTDVTEGAGTSSFDVVASSLPASDITVNIEISGSAEPGVDYTISGVSLTQAGAVWTGSVTVPAATGSMTLVVTPLTDGTMEGPEPVILTIVGGTGYTVGTPASAQLSILDGSGGSGGGGGDDDEGGCSTAAGETSLLMALALLSLSLLFLRMFLVRSRTRAFRLFLVPTENSIVPISGRS